MIRTLAALALAQGGWLAIAALAAADRPGYAALVAVAAWLGVVAIARARLRTALLALIAAALGPLADAALVRAGLLDVRGGVAWCVLMPFWWWGLWGLFAASLPTSFGWQQIWRNRVSGFFRFCTAIIGLAILTSFFACSGILNHPGASTARAADMLDSNKGIASPNPRFTDNSNGTVTDDRTGLIWLQNANVVGARTWADALPDVENLNRDGTMNGTFAGDKSNDGSHQNDWRLPNRNELSSLTDSSNNIILPFHPVTLASLATCSRTATGLVIPSREE